MRQFGIHCSIVEPGRFRTAFLDGKTISDRISRAWDRLDNERKNEYGGEAFKELCMSFVL